MGAERHAITLVVVSLEVFPEQPTVASAVATQQLQTERFVCSRRTAQGRLHITARRLAHHLRPTRLGTRSAGKLSRPSAHNSSSNRRHSRFFSPPLGRFHSSSSHTVREISVTPSAANSKVVLRINSSYATEKLRPPKTNAPSHDG